MYDAADAIDAVGGLCRHVAMSVATSMPEHTNMLPSQSIPTCCHHRAYQHARAYENDSASEQDSAYKQDSASEHDRAYEQDSTKSEQDSAKSCSYAIMFSFLGIML